MSYASKQPIESETTSHEYTTDITKEWTYLGYTYNYVAASLDLFLGFQAILINMLIILFYMKKLSRVVPFMYVAIATVDLVTGIGALLSGMVFTLIEAGKPTYGFYLSYGIYFITLVTFKASAFLNCTIAVIRTINIKLPFYEVKMVLVVAALTVYGVLCTLFPLYLILRDPLTPHHTILVGYMFTPEGFIPNNRDDYSINQWIMVIITGVSMALPAIIVFICMVIQIESLSPWRQGLRRRDTLRSCSSALGRSASTSTMGANTSATHSRLTVTIIMLSMLFFVCNLIHMNGPINLRNANIIDLTDEEKRQLFRTSYALGSISLFANAAWSPVILVIRGEALIRFLRTKFSFTPSASSSRTKKMGILAAASPSPPPRPRVLEPQKRLGDTHI